MRSKHNDQLSVRTENLYTEFILTIIFFFCLQRALSLFSRTKDKCQPLELIHANLHLVAYTAIIINWVFLVRRVMVLGYLAIAFHRILKYLTSFAAMSCFIVTWQSQHTYSNVCFVHTCVFNNMFVFISILRYTPCVLMRSCLILRVHTGSAHSLTKICSTRASGKQSTNSILLLISQEFVG